MTLPRSFRVGDKRWRIRWERPDKELNAFALTEFDAHTVVIAPDLDDRTMLAAVCDEVCHAAFGPMLDNDEVDKFSDACADLLYRLGFRREDE